MLISFFLFIVGLGLLYFGAEWLVKGSSSLARSLGLSSLVIGLTVVAFGTSTPELVVSVVSAVKGKSMIAIGNVIGSNICNIALVLGLAALFQPITSDPGVVRRDIPIMLALSGYVTVLSANSSLSRLDGATLVAGIILYTYLNYYIARRQRLPVVSALDMVAARAETAPVITSRVRQIGLVLVGIAGVIVGADMLIRAAVTIMERLGVSQKFIALTMVAFGTSLPELATSVVAAIRKEMDISLGNLVGSNVFNLLCVLGASSLVRPILIPGGFVASGLVVDYAVMLLISFLPWLLMRRRYRLGRRGGILLLACYVGYLAYLMVRL